MKLYKYIIYMLGIIAVPLWVAFIPKKDKSENSVTLKIDTEAVNAIEKIFEKFSKPVAISDSQGNNKPATEVSPCNRLIAQLEELQKERKEVMKKNSEYLRTMNRKDSLMKDVYKNLVKLVNDELLNKPFLNISDIDSVRSKLKTEKLKLYYESGQASEDSLGLIPLSISPTLIGTPR